MIKSTQNQIKQTFSFNSPLKVNATPNLAVLVGKTQSNISTPKATQTRRSIG